jgi:hypothetical protein
VACLLDSVSDHFIQLFNYLIDTYLML